MKYLIPCLLLLIMPGLELFAMGPAFKAISLHGPESASGELIQVEGEAIKVSATGRDSYFATDDGTFVYFKPGIEDWRFTVRVKSIDAEKGLNTKTGIALRTGLKRWNRGLHIRYDAYKGNRSIQWLHRYHVAHGAHDGGRRTMSAGLEKEMASTESFWLRMEYRFPTITAYYSEDGKQWQEIAADRRFNLLETDLYLGLMLTAGGDGKTAVSATYDQISFETLAPQAESLLPDQFKEYKPLMPKWDLYVAQDVGEHVVRGGGSWMLMKPKGMKWNEIRALFLSTGSKEIIKQEDDGSLSKLDYSKGVGKLRIPQGITKKSETLYEIRPKPMYRIFEDNGLVHLAGAGDPKTWKLGLKKLSEVTGYPIDQIPIVAEGGSFAGGFSAKFAKLYPERTIAVAPGIIGIAGWPEGDPEVLKIPHLYCFGTKDGPHLKQILKADQEIRLKEGRWAAMPMHWHYHDWGYAYNMSFPWFLDVIKLRVPEDADSSKSLVQLKDIPEDQGWIATADSINSNFPTVIPWAQATEEQRRGDSWWLPSERSARLWQAGASNQPGTVIQFPRFDHTIGWGAALNKPENQYHQMKANEPFNLMASGPRGKNVTVTYYADLKPLKVLKRYRNDPYLVQLEGLPAGLHNIYAITKIGDEEEISRSQMIFFNEE